MCFAKAPKVQQAPTPAPPPPPAAPPPDPQEVGSARKSEDAALGRTDGSDTRRVDNASVNLSAAAGSGLKL